MQPTATAAATVATAAATVATDAADTAAPPPTTTAEPQRVSSISLARPAMRTTAELARASGRRAPEAAAKSNHIVWAANGSAAVYIYINELINKIEPLTRAKIRLYSIINISIVGAYGDFYRYLCATPGRGETDRRIASAPRYHRRGVVSVRGWRQGVYAILPKRSEDLWKLCEKSSPGLCIYLLYA